MLVLQKNGLLIERAYQRNVLRVETTGFSAFCKEAVVGCDGGGGARAGACCGMLAG